MKTKHTQELPKLDQVFNLSAQESNDGWRDTADLNQSLQDQQEAAKRQTDMFPDVYLTAKPHS